MSRVNCCIVPLSETFWKSSVAAKIDHTQTSARKRDCCCNFIVVLTTTTQLSTFLVGTGQPPDDINRATKVTGQ